MCRFNSVVVNNGTAVAYSSMSTSTRPHPPVGVSGAVEIATRRERSSPGSVGLARSSPTNKNPAYAAYLPCPPHGWRKIVTGIPPARTDRDPSEWALSRWSRGIPHNKHRRQNKNRRSRLCYQNLIQKKHSAVRKRREPAIGWPRSFTPVFSR